jgi:hypothetical protein
VSNVEGSKVCVRFCRVQKWNGDAMEPVTTTKFVFETVAAIIGMSKEGMGLADKLRERKATAQGVLEKKLALAGIPSAESEKAVKELYQNIQSATPYVRRLVKKRILIRIQILALAGIGLSLLIWFGKLWEKLPWWGQPVSAATQWILLPLGFIISYFAGTWFLRVRELKTAGAQIDDLKDLASNKVFEKLPEWLRTKINNLAQEIAFRDRSVVNGLDRVLLEKYGALSSMVDLLETASLADSCAESELSIGGYMRSEMDRCVIAILKDATEPNCSFGEPPRNCETTIERELFETFQAAGIGYVVNAKRYQKPLVKAVEAYKEGKDISSKFYEVLKESSPDLFAKSLIESQRVSALTRFKIFSRSVSKGIQNGFTAQKDESE